VIVSVLKVSNFDSLFPN